MNRRCFAVLAAIGLLCSLAAAQNRKPSNSPSPENGEPPKVPGIISADAKGLGVDPKSYLIGPEDVLRILVWRDPELSGTAVVRPDGKITRPLIGDVQAAGLTPERLAGQLREAYSSGGKLLNPEIMVEVIEVNSKRYSVTGEVNRSGKYPLIVPTKVFEALSLAGFKDWANKKDIIIIREDGSRLHFNYLQFVKGKTKKDLEQNVLLVNGDTILVTQ